MTEKTDPTEEFDSAFDEFGAQQQKEEPGQVPGSVVIGAENAAGEGGDGGAPAAPAEPAKPAAAEPAQQADDPWQTAPDNLRTQYQQLREDNARLQRRAVSDSGRIRALNDRLKNHGAAASAASSTAVPTAQQVAEAARTPGGIAQLKEDYPEVAAALETEIAAAAQVLRQEIDHLRSSVAAPQQFVQEFDQASRDAAVEAAHEGWKQTVATPDFAEWLDAQPEFIQTATASENPADAIGLLNLFKASRAAPQPQTQEPVSRKPSERVMRAASPPTRRASAPTPLPADDFDAAFDHFASKR